MARRGDLRLPSLAQVAGPDILSLDFRQPSYGASFRGPSPGPMQRVRRLSSSTDMRGSSTPMLAGYDEPMSGFTPLSPFDLPMAGFPSSAEGMGMSRSLRHTSSTASLRGSLDNDGHDVFSSRLLPLGNGYSAGRGHLAPLPPLNKTALSYAPESAYPTPLTGTFPSLDRGGMQLPRLGESRLPSAKLGPRPYAESMDLSAHPMATGGHKQNTPLLSSHRRGFSGSPGGGSSLLPPLPPLDVASLSSSRPRRTLEGTMPRSLANPLPPGGILSWGSTGLGSKGLGLLPLPSPSASRETSKTGHIVLSTDFRCVRLSANILVWLGLTPGSMYGSLNSPYGRQLATLVADSERASFEAYLQQLQAERRNAEMERMHSVAEGGSGTAKGVSVTVRLVTASGKAKPFVLTVWPITRRIQGYKQAVLTGELIPLFSEASAAISSISPL